MYCIKAILVLGHCSFITTTGDGKLKFFHWISDHLLPAQVCRTNSFTWQISTCSLLKEGALNAGICNFV